MNAFTAQHDLAFDVEALRSRPLDAAPRRSRLAAAVGWFIDLPRRRAVIDELQSLSDHELADIGLERAEVARVFDRRFAERRLGA